LLKNREKSFIALKDTLYNKIQLLFSMFTYFYFIKNNQNKVQIQPPYIRVKNVAKNITNRKTARQKKREELHSGLGCLGMEEP
jgi:hypothetical protein